MLSSLTIDLATLSEYTGGRYAVIQRDPQPNETDIDKDTHIKMMLVDLEGAQSSSSSGFGHGPFGHFPFGHAAAMTFGIFDFDVYVDGDRILSWNKTTETATWYLGYTGTVTPSLPTTPYAFYIVDAIPPSEFSSEQIVEVRAVVTPSAPALDVTYQFEVEDLTPPNIISADSIDSFTIRMTFDDNMSVEGLSSALNISSYSIERLNIDPMPGVNLIIENITAVEGSSDTQFDIVVDWEQTPGCQYSISVTQDVTDSSSNPMIPDASILFNGFSPIIPAGRRFSHWRQMVPLKNRLEDSTQDAERFSNCIQEILNLMLHEIDRFTDQFDPDLCSDEQIDVMLLDMGNPFDWAELELTAAQRRKLLRFLLDIYLSKGTATGIEQTVLFLLGEVIQIVDYLSEGWVLGVDALGEGDIAQLPTLAVAPYDFTAVAQPWSMGISIDNESVQTITFAPGDFLDPSVATAEEVTAVITSTLIGANTYIVNDGEPAIITNNDVGPYSIAYGTNIIISAPTTSSSPTSYTFKAGDFTNENIVTANELVALLTRKFPNVTIEANQYKGVVLRTFETGTIAHISLSGTATLSLGFQATEIAVGKEGERFYIYSETAGTNASIECTTADAGIADEIFKIWMNPIEATGSTILAPDDSYTKYSFDIVTSEVLDLETESLVRQIAEYMKPAHTHLINIRTAPDLQLPDNWEIGVGKLDESTSLAQ
jgi:phage tail-like protein